MAIKPDLDRYEGSLTGFAKTFGTPDADEAMDRVSERLVEAVTEAATKSIQDALSTGDNVAAAFRHRYLVEIFDWLNTSLPESLIAGASVEPGVVTLHIGEEILPEPCSAEFTLKSIAEDVIESNDDSHMRDWRDAFREAAAIIDEALKPE